ncbi:MAG: hypothetical protein IPL35_14670 [Sphingobacteriales bacterium]|nr:hypothetical protein [Sphingobacteriales bacterium]
MLKKILLLVLLMPFGLMAQDNLENENITIIKAFEPILLDAQRPDLFPWRRCRSKAIPVVRRNWITAYPPNS